MQEQEIRQFLNRFFKATSCEIVHDNGKAFTVQLTIDMDKALMNRPFYWHYIEKTNGTPNPQKITLITDFSTEKNLKGEKIHFGSPRLHQIFPTDEKTWRIYTSVRKSTGVGQKSNSPLSLVMHEHKN